MQKRTHSAVISMAAIGSVLAASSCCLPVLPFAMAAGFAGGSTILSGARPCLLGTSILLIAYGFYQSWQEKKCRRQPSVTGAILLWVSTAFVAIAIFFPQAMANAAADWLVR
jgi:hypothetical protein